MRTQTEGESLQLLALSFGQDVPDFPDGWNRPIPLARRPEDPRPPWDWVRQTPDRGAPLAYVTLSSPANRTGVCVWVQNVGPTTKTARLRLETSPANLLGEGTSAAFTLESGQDGHVWVELNDTALQGHGVDQCSLSWTCVVQLGCGDTGDQVSGTHRLYTLLGNPTLPWGHMSGGAEPLPWPDLLDFVCEWARGAKTEDDAAGQIARKVFGLGRDLYPPDCTQTYLRYTNGPKYTDLEFRLTDAPGTYGSFFAERFLRRLRGMSTADLGLANCTDCAAIVSTCANLLGCSLDQVRIADSSICTHPVVVLGAVPGSWSGRHWSLHDVAWQGELGRAGRVWDASAAVDGNGNPATNPREELVAAGLELGGIGDPESYRYRLLRHDGSGVLTLPPEYHTRRPLRPYPEDHPSERSEGRGTQTRSQFASVFVDTLLPSWKFAAVESISEIQWAFAAEARWETLPGSLFKQVVYVRVHFRETVAAAEAAFRVLREALHSAEAREALDEEVGDEHCGDPEQSIVFRRGPIVVTLDRYTLEPFSLSPHAAALDARLRGLLAQGG